VARIRSIKPELLEDEKTATLSHLEFRVFVSLLLVADDYGNFRAAKARIQGAVLWAHEDDVGPVLERLATVGLLKLYTVGGQAYGHITGWSKHQKVDKPGKPMCPGPDAPSAVISIGTREAVANDSRIARDPVAPDLDLDLDLEDDREESCSDPPPAASEPAILVFPTVGRGPREFGLTRSMLDAWADAWPGIDVLAEAKKALAWVNANPTKRKTAAGMPAFLTRWCNRAQDRIGGIANGATGPPRDVQQPYYPILTPRKLGPNP